MLAFCEHARGFGNFPLLYLFFEESINVFHGNLGIDRVEPFIFWIRFLALKNLDCQAGCEAIRQRVKVLGCCRVTDFGIFATEAKHCLSG